MITNPSDPDRGRSGLAPAGGGPISGERPTGVMAVVVGWILLQVPRIVAIQLLADVAAGTESVAWRYPAIVDIGSAIAAPVVAWLLWRRRGPRVWAGAIVFLALCVFDAGNAAVVGLDAPTPAIFGGPGSEFVVYPVLAGLISLSMMGLLASRRVVSFEVGDARAVRRQGPPA